MKKDDVFDRVDLSLKPWSRADVRWDVKVDIKPLWKRVPENIAERIERENAEVRFRAFAHEIERYIRQRLENEQ